MKELMKWIKRVLKEHKDNVEYCRSLDNNPMVIKYMRGEL
jgi:hypothetical protein